MDVNEALFSVETYWGARIKRPDLDTYICDNVKDEALRIILRRRHKDWGVTIEVSAQSTKEFEAKPVILYRTSQPATEKQKEFWNEMNDLAFASTEEDSDLFRSWACQVLSREDKPKPKKKEK